MAYFHNRLDYNTCSTDELRSFIKNRTKQDLQEWTKQELVAELQSLDDAATFPLMSLPNELRLCIYDELAFHPEILATSRGIHEEARPILDGMNTVTTLRLESRPAPSRRQHPRYLVSEPAIRVNDGQWLHLPQETRDVSVVEDFMSQLTSWPEEIANARRLDVTINCTGLGTIPLSLRVYQLATLLTGSSSEIRLQVQNLPQTESMWDLLSDIFWPLLLMGPRVELILQGFQKETVDCFKRGVLETQTPSMTALYRYRCFQERIKQVGLLAKEAGIGWSCMDLYTTLSRARQLARHYYCPNKREDAEWFRLLEDLEREVSVLGPYARIRKEALAILEARKIAKR